MELQQLQYFLVAARYEHITKAANSLHIAQPALSQSIKRLEAELGVKLFERKKGGITLSKAGKLLAEEVKPIVSTIEALPRKLADVDKKQNSTIHLNVLAASILVTNCIISYKAKHPDINFEFVQSPSAEDYDLCITATLPKNVAVSDQITLEEKFYLAVPASSKYAAYPEIDLAEVADEGFIMMADTRPIRSICDQFCMEAGFTPNIIFESMNFESVRSLISAGLGVGFWPEYSWESAEPSKNVVLLPVKGQECKRDIVITCNSQSEKNVIVKDFYDYLIAFAMECRDKHQRSREKK
ncbi:MAG: LysR family transcriptional regulator [Lachnospiraceae bacterium]|jgi:DNA-binding transcriptional LysR family regulator|nr:LysR family transcriptional regulator [Lachnospiraceae bacterium]